MVVVGDTSVVVVGAVVVGVLVVGAIVVVDVDVGGGITNPFAHPQRISIGAPIGVPCAPGVSSIMRRSCAHPSHAEMPVVRHPPRIWEHAAVCTVIAPIRSGLPCEAARADMTAHWRD